VKRLLILIAVVALALLVVTVPIAGAAGNPNPRVIPPNSRVQGLTYGGWMAKWWQYAFSLPASENPIVGATDPASTVQFVGNVGLVLADSVAQEQLTLTVPVGTKLFLEVLGSECSTLEEAPFDGGNEAGLIESAQALLPVDLEGSIDGVALRNLGAYIRLSPLYRFTLPDDNILGVAAGSGQSVASGAYLMLAPLTPGVHMIHLHGYIPLVDFTADRTIEVFVTH
jgi:hypothetical protein